MTDDTTHALVFLNWNPELDTSDADELNTLILESESLFSEDFLLHWHAAFHAYKLRGVPISLTKGLKP